MWPRIWQRWLVMDNLTRAFIVLMISINVGTFASLVISFSTPFAVLWCCCCGLGFAIICIKTIQSGLRMKRGQKRLYRITLAYLTEQTRVDTSKLSPDMQEDIAMGRAQVQLNQEAD